MWGLRSCGGLGIACILTRVSRGILKLCNGLSHEIPLRIFEEYVIRGTRLGMVSPNGDLPQASKRDLEPKGAEFEEDFFRLAMD